MFKGASAGIWPPCLGTVHDDSIEVEKDERDVSDRGEDGLFDEAGVEESNWPSPNEDMVDPAS